MAENKCVNSFFHLHKWSYFTLFPIYTCSWFLVDTPPKKWVTWTHQPFQDLPPNSPPHLPWVPNGTNFRDPKIPVESPESYFLVAEEISIHTWQFQIPLGFFSKVALFFTDYKNCLEKKSTR